MRSRPMPSTLPNLSCWCSRMATTRSTTIRRRLPSTLPLPSSLSWTSYSSVANSPASIRLARSTSWAAVRRGTLPISFRYIRTGSFVGAFSRSTSRRAATPGSTRSSPGTSMTSIPSFRRCSSTWVRNSSTCSGVKSSTGTASSRSSEVTNPRSRPRAAIDSFASSRPRSRATSVNGSPRMGDGGWPEVYETPPAATHGPQPTSHGRFVPLLQPTELAIGRDELPEQGVVLGVRGGIEPLEAPPEVRAPAAKRELLEPGPHVLGVLHRLVAVQWLQSEGGGRTGQLVVVGAGHGGPDVAARRHQEPEQLPVLGRLEVLLGQALGHLVIDGRVAGEKPEHLPLHPVVDRGSLHGLTNLGRSSRHPPLQREQDRGLGHTGQLGQPVGVLALADRVGQALQDGQGRRHSGALALDGRQVVAPDTSQEHVLDDGLSPDREDAEGVSAALADEVGRVQPLRQDQDDRLDGEPFEEPERALRRPGPRLVGVEGQHHPLGES